VTISDEAIRIHAVTIGDFQSDVNER
jgi:hypothetical protein